MNTFKKATKRITAVAASAALVSSAVFGANLANYPTNFVDNGEFEGTVVIGSTADSAAATSIISDLASELSGDSEKVKITAKMTSTAGGDIVNALDDNEVLNFGESGSAIVVETLDEDSTNLLEDSDLDGDDYTQELVMGNAATTEFNHQLFDDVKGETEAKTGLFFKKGDTFATYTLEFDSALDTDTDSEIEQKYVGETLTIMGNEFTVLAISTTGLTLVGGANKVSLGEGESSTVTVEGVSYDVEVQSVSDKKILLTINGESKSVDYNEVEDIAGVTVGITEIVDSSRDSVKGYATLVIGGQKVELGTSKSDLEINDDKFDDIDMYDDYKVEATFDGAGKIEVVYKVDEDTLLAEGDSLSDVLFDSFTLSFDGTNNVDYSELTISTTSSSVDFEGNLFNGNSIPDEFELSTESEDTAKILLGSVSERIYFKGSALVTKEADVTADDLNGVTATGLVANVDEVVTVVFDTNGNAIAAANVAGYTKTVSTTNAIYTATGNVVDAVAGDFSGMTGYASFSIAQGTTALAADTILLDLTVSASDIEGQKFFGLENGDDEDMRLFEVTGYDDNSGETDNSKITIKELFETETPVDSEELNDNKLGDLEMDSALTETDDTLAIDTDLLGLAQLYLENELYMDFTNVEAGTQTLVFSYKSTELEADDKTDYTSDILTLTIAAATDRDDQITLDVDMSTSEIKDGSDIEVAVDAFGTMVTIDTEDSDSVIISVPSEEVFGKVSFNFGAAGSSVETYTVDADMEEAKVAELEEAGYTVTTESVSSEAVEFDITAPVMADEVSGTEDMIVVGGPAVNAVAATLLGEGVVGVSEGEAVVRYFAESNSVLVYGYDAAGTQAAANKLNAGGLTGEEVNVQ